MLHLQTLFSISLLLSIVALMKSFSLECLSITISGMEDAASEGVFTEHMPLLRGFCQQVSSLYCIQTAESDLSACTTADGVMLDLNLPNQASVPYMEVTKPKPSVRPKQLCCSSWTPCRDGFVVTDSL